MKNRPERLICFLVVWLTMFSCIQVEGQKSLPPGAKTDFLQLRYPRSPIEQIYPNLPVYESEMICFPGPSDEEQSGVSAYIRRNPFNGLSWRLGGLYIQPADLYYIQSGFFCKREWELEKTTHLPIRFRLGSLADCNALEGKH